MEVKKMFSYLYYRLYKFAEKLDDKHPGEYAGYILTVIQAMNLSSIIITFFKYFNLELSINLYMSALPIIALLLFNNYFHIKRFPKYVQKWTTESDSKKENNGFLIVAYIAISIFYFLWIITL